MSQLFPKKILPLPNKQNRKLPCGRIVSNRLGLLVGIQISTTTGGSDLWQMSEQYRGNHDLLGTVGRAHMLVGGKMDWPTPFGTKSSASWDGFSRRRCSMDLDNVLMRDIRLMLLSPVTMAVTRNVQGPITDTCSRAVQQPCSNRR